MIPPGVGSMPIISGIAASATRRLRKSPCIAGTSRAESPICPIASPTTLTNKSKVVSETNKYGVVRVSGPVCHSAARRSAIWPGETPSSTARTPAATTIAAPIRSPTRSEPTRTSNATKMVPSAYIDVTVFP